MRSLAPAGTGSLGRRTFLTLCVVGLELTPDAPSRALVDRLVGLTRSAGYQPTPVQPELGRFAMRAHHRDRHGEYFILVQCFGDGFVELRPVGEGVRPSQGRFEVPPALRDEVVRLAEAMLSVVRSSEG